jgi:hypothetical protein
MYVAVVGAYTPGNERVALPFKRPPSLKANARSFHKSTVGAASSRMISTSLFGAFVVVVDPTIVVLVLLFFLCAIRRGHYCQHTTWLLPCGDFGVGQRLPEGPSNTRQEDSFRSASRWLVVSQTTFQG